jgi:hypothetical protein
VEDACRSGEQLSLHQSHGKAGQVTLSGFFFAEKSSLTCPSEEKLKYSSKVPEL